MVIIDGKYVAKKTIENICADHIPRLVSNEIKDNRDLYKPISKAKVEKFNISCCKGRR